jgi:predicted RND superfamily exporter protein
MSLALAAFIYRWRFLLSGLIVVGALLLSPRANITHIDNDITAWFSRDDPVYRDYERFREEFAGTRSLIVALQADSAERLFSHDTLSFIDRISGDIERVETVQRVDSLATATIVEALPLPRAPSKGPTRGPDGEHEEGGLDVRPLLNSLSRGGPQEVRRRALKDDLLRGDLVSDDATTTAIVVSFDEDRIDDVRAGVIQKIHDIVDPGLPPGVRAYYNGSLEISETYNRITLDNQQKFTPPILLFTIGAIYLTFRSVRKTFLAMVAIAISVLWSLGLFSVMGYSFNVLASMLVPLIVVLAIADDVHIMQHWDEERRRGDAEHAFKATVAHLTAPLFGASATTALGMLSLATSEVVAVQSFGVGSAVGIMVDFVVSLVLMPTMLSLVKPDLREAPHEKFLMAPLHRIARLSCAHPRRVLAVALAVSVVAAFGMLRLRVDTNHINFFSPDHPLGQSAAVIDKQLSGVYSFQIMLEGPPDSMQTPDTLQRMNRLQERLREFPYVRKVTSVADYVRRINKELNDGRPEADVVPTDQATIAQELFVFALGGEGRHELQRVVASDFSRAQIAVKLQSMSSDLVLEEVEEADRLAKEIFSGTGIEVLTTGSGRLFATLDHYLVTSQLSSFGTAFVTVFAVIFVVFRSFRFGLLTVAPNVLPVLVVLGVMGYLDISMNIATVMVASVALGVVDDDTIHFINRYRRETAVGATTDEAITIATAHEGRASLTTAIINSCGFGVLLVSEYKPTAWFGGLLALTMALAFLAEVFILPAMIKLLPRMYSAESVRRARTAGAVVAVLLISGPVFAEQWPTGHVSVFADYMPNQDDTTELRSRVFVEDTYDLTRAVRVNLSGYLEGLLAHRAVPDVDQPVTDAFAAVHDASLEVTKGRLDLLVGYARTVWGRLDELQPSDVINPLDVSRFFFDGRSEARLPVLTARARVTVAGDAVVELVYLPMFRRGRFDRLDEATSPFNLVRLETPLENVVRGPAQLCLPSSQSIERDAPPVSFENAQGGVRFSTTIGRVDWSVSTYHGFEPFGLLVVDPAAPPLTIAERHPRFTMIAGDFETVSGEWGLRGEVAVFVDDNFQLAVPAVVDGHSVDAGLGFDRKAGDYTVSGTVLFHSERYDTPIRNDGSASQGRADVSLIASADRTFGREKYRLRTFGVYNPNESSGFARTIVTASLRDNFALEGSVGWFIGTGRDVIGRFAASDFLYLRLRYYF